MNVIGLWYFIKIFPNIIFQSLRSRQKRNSFPLGYRFFKRKLNITQFSIQSSEKQNWLYILQNAKGVPSISQTLLYE